MQTVASLYEKTINPAEAGGLLFGAGAKLDQEVSCFLLLLFGGNEVIVDVVGRLIEEVRPGERKVKLTVSDAEAEIADEFREGCRCIKEKLGIVSETSGNNNPPRVLKTT